MYLGISAYTHDASAAIVDINGRAIAAVEEERFSRQKHERRFPVGAIQYCLETAGVRAQDLLGVGFPRNPLAILGRKIMLSNLFLEPVGLDDWLADLTYLWKVLTTGRRFRRMTQCSSKYPRLCFVDHHIAHASSAFYASPFDVAAYLTADGMGEWQCATWGRADRNGLHRLGHIDYPNSAGMVYQAVARFLGLEGGDRAGKLMGLASWGQPVYTDLFRQVIRTLPDGTHRIAYEHFDFHRKPRVSQRFVPSLRHAARGPGDTIGQIHMDVAASLQQVLCEAMLNLVRKVHRDTGCHQLVLAGGVFLNSVLNGRILQETPINDIYVQPATHDAGLSIGCAYHLLHSDDCDAPRKPLLSAALGPMYERQEIARAIVGVPGIVQRQVSCPATEAARILSDGKAIGWFHGRLEYGPRALGHRSILADPRPQEMRDHLNQLKGRESFRPFAAAVLEEHVERWFDGVRHSPFMLQVGTVRFDRVHLIPAVVHVDGSSRIQTVSRTVSPRFHKLLEAFFALTGIPLVLNTSLNKQGAPIVCSPKQAVDMYLESELAALMLENVLVQRPKDASARSGNMLLETGGNYIKMKRGVFR